MPRRDLLDERRFTLDEPLVLLSRFPARQHVPLCGPSGRGEIGCQMFAVGLSTEHEVPRRFE